MAENGRLAGIRQNGRIPVFSVFFYEESYIFDEKRYIIYKTRHLRRHIFC